MEQNKKIRLLIIDGQGGKLGKQLIESIRAVIPNIQITAVGTNSAATSNMVKAGTDSAATGENAVIVGSRTADIIVGPIGIVIADSLAGEITPSMALAVGQSGAVRILIPINKCNNIIVGVPDLSVTKLIESTIQTIKTLTA